MESSISTAWAKGINCRKTKHFVLVCILAISVLASGCSEPNDANKVVSGQQPILQLDPKAIISEKGLAFVYHAPQLANEADITEQENRSPYALTEDGKLLAPAHAIHDDIRNNGKGKWSHWGGVVYFSSSDGTDPRQNKRKYVLMK
jgi:hypothetical protein